ncbi:Electron transfer flavoprotein-quinone oxidoreductase (FixC protein) [Propionibacterium freudenreichii]|nr:FAD-dependent oxidoreductase [Propionibacterium freudenreichii]CEH08590.1 Electron transfer flavoprotein-quinone oxidoreductase (FixC protein) [Propionibacterium freudenreichii]
MADEDEDIFDVVVIGGGVAGCTAAYKLAQQGHSVVLIERAAQPGSKNLSGGVFYCRVMEQVFPGFVDNAPVERRITRNVVSFANPTSTVNIDYWDQRLAEPVNAVSVLRAKLDAWLSEQCEEAGVMVMPGVKVDELVIEGGQVVGVRAGEDELRARIVIAADGVNSFIAQQAGIRPKEPKKSLAVGVKSVIALDPATIEQRFHCSGDEGTAYAVVGDCTQGVAGGGFLYTNKESISIGVVLRLDDLVAKGLASSDVHDHFLAHPAIAPLLEGGSAARIRLSPHHRGRSGDGGPRAASRRPDDRGRCGGVHPEHRPDHPRHGPGGGQCAGGGLGRPSCADRQGLLRRVDGPLRAQSRA